MVSTDEEGFLSSSKMRRMKIITLACLTTLSGCAWGGTETREIQSAHISWDDNTREVTLVLSDVQLGEYDGGVTVRDDWTLAAQDYISRSVSDYLSARSVSLHVTPELTNRFVTGLEPTFDNFDIDGQCQPGMPPNSLSHLGGSQSDLVLLICAHDLYSSAGQAATDLFLGTLFTAGAAFLVAGSPTPSVAQIASASLIDSRNGNVIWQSRSVRRSGDLRTLEGAENMVERLLEDFPL